MTLLGEEHGFLEVLPHDPARRRADREVILLLHGTGGSKDDWRFPDWRENHFAYDRTPADLRTNNQLTPPIPLLSDVMPADLSDLRSDIRCWSGVMTALGHTVISYSQRGKDDAIVAAQTQFEQRIVPFIRDEVLVGALAGKRVVVVAHSRGGILVRAYLHGFPADGQQWIGRVITLCSPHRGTLAPTARDRLGDQLEFMPGGPLIRAGLQFFFGVFSENDAHLELLPDDPLFDRLANPSDVPDIRFQTMGGTSIRWSRVYVRVFTPDSYVPNLLDFPDIRFDWRQAAVEIPFVSPVLDSVAPLLGLEEIRQGAGDIAVADDRARLPGAPHRSFPVNHAEALWDERVFAWVAEQLGTPLSQLAGDVDCGRPTGGVRFTPSTVVFDQVRAGQVRTRIVRATNGTADPVRLSFAAARTDLPFQWGALDVTLPPGEVADFEVRYRAPDGRDRTEELRVTSSQSTRPHAIGLVVHGVGGFDPTPEEPPPPTRLSVPPVISFGSVALGQESRRDLVVRNDTGRLVRVIVAASPAGSVFRWPALDTSVANGTQRSLTITFRPSTGAIVQSQVLLRNDLPASPLVVGLVGKGPGGFEVPDGDSPARSAERTVTD